MSAFEMTETKLICPTSGPLLRAAVHAFRLMQHGVDSADTGLVGIVNPATPRPAPLVRAVLS